MAPKQVASANPSPTTGHSHIPKMILQIRVPFFPLWPSSPVQVSAGRPAIHVSHGSEAGVEGGLQGLIKVLISFQEAAVRRLTCEPGKQPRHSWRERERKSGDKADWLVFWLRRNRTMNGPPRLVRSGTLGNMVVL